MNKLLRTLLLSFILTLFFNYQSVYAQNQQKIDSLLSKLDTTTNDSNKVNILYSLCRENLRSSSSKAKEFAEKALHLSEIIGYQKGTSISLCYMGIVYANQSNYNIAVYYFKKSAKMAKELDNTRLYSICLNRIGIILKNQGDYDKAIEYQEEAFGFYKERSDNEGITDCLINIGIIYINQSNYSKAIENFEKALKISKERRDKRRISSCLHNIGITYNYLGDYVEALEYYQESIKMMKELGDKKEISNVLNSIGLIHFYMSNYEKALEYYEKALKISKDYGDKRVIVSCLHNIGTIYHNQGNNDVATEYYQKTLNILTELGDKRRISKCLLNIGTIHENESNYNRAIDFFQRSMKISKELSSRDITSDCSSAIGLVYYSQGKYKRAIEYLSKSLKIDNEIEDKKGISYSLNNLGNIYMDQGKFDLAIKFFQNSLKIKKEIKDKSAIVYCLNSLSETYLRMHNYNKALLYCQQALIANFSGFNDTIVCHNPNELKALSKPYLLETLNQKAKTLYLQYQKEKTLKDIEVSIYTYGLAFRLINQMRNDYSSENTKLLLSKNTKNQFADALLASIEHNKSGEDKIDKVFEFLEKSKSATLGSYLSILRIKESMNIEDTLMEKEKDIAIYRRFYDTNIQKIKAQEKGYDTTLLQEYQDKLFNYSRQSDTLMATLKEKHPDYYELKYLQNVAKVEDIQKSLSEKGALLNYFVGDTILFIATVTKDTLVYKVINTDSLFDQKIIDYHIDIKSGFTKNDLKNSNYLYNYLIKPIEDLIKEKEELIILPDENLYYVPFETLCKKNVYNENLSKIDYLIKDYPVTYHHSATLWLNSKQKEDKNIAQNNSFIGFAPVFDPKVNNGYIVSNEWITDTTNTDIASRAVSSDMKHLNSLPHSEEEINSIVKLFTKSKKKAVGYFHNEANEANFINKVEDYSYIHIATHSFVNDKYPKLSGIAFSQPDTTLKETEDGILYAGETYNLNLSKADLVVLSSCKSGLGKLIKGEGFLSLSRGFLYSGAPNIIFSLWNVQDEQTKDLMIQFYKKVLKKKDYAKALREAKLKFIKNPKTASPKYWAAWVLVGK